MISLAAQSAGRAEAAYRRADRRGSMYAASVLARLLERRGDLSTAEVAYRRAADLDYLDEITHTLNATGNLARFLERRGDLAGTEAVLRQAMERGAAPRGHRSNALGRFYRVPTVLTGEQGRHLGRRSARDARRPCTGSVRAVEGRSVMRTGEGELGHPVPLLGDWAVRQDPRSQVALKRVHSGLQNTALGVSGSRSAPWSRRATATETQEAGCQSVSFSVSIRFRPACCWYRGRCG
jgi:hypothetical protein